MLHAKLHLPAFVATVICCPEAFDDPEIKYIKTQQNPRKLNYFSKEKMNQIRCLLQDNLGIDQSPDMKSNKV